MQGGQAGLAKRIGIVGPLGLGLIIGGAGLTAIVFCAQRMIDENASGLKSVILGGLVVFLLLDVWTLLRHKRIYPIGLRRQTRKGLMHGRTRQTLVGLVWGLDAGFGFFTYRVTSGLWVLIFVTVLSDVPAVLVTTYSFGFAVSLMIVTWTPTAGHNAVQRAETASARIFRLVGQYRQAQALYSFLLAGLVVLFASTNLQQ